MRDLSGWVKNGPKLGDPREKSEPAPLNIIRVRHPIPAYSQSVRFAPTV
jgi:hypothetical protein